MQMRRFGPVICTIATILATAACEQKGAPTTAATTGTSNASPASPTAKPGMTITGARLVLPAVSGRPAAVYFSIVNTGDRPETIVDVAVHGAKQAQMHETEGGSMTMVKTLTVPPKATAMFAPGERHVMVFGLPAALRVGGSSELTLTFAGGPKVSAPLVVLAPGSGGHDDMAGMTMDH